MGGANRRQGVVCAKKNVAGCSVTHAVGGGWVRGRKADPVQDEWEQNWDNGGRGEEHGAAVRMVKKENGEGLGSKDIWEMGEKGELNNSSHVFDLGNRWCHFPRGATKTLFRFEGVAFEVPEEQAKGESILVKEIRN